MNYLEDKDLGKIRLIPNTRSKSITARVKGDSLQISYPPYLKVADLEKAILAMKPKLQKLKERSTSITIFTPYTEFKTFSFKLVISENNCSNSYTQLKDGILSITFPENTIYENLEIQKQIRSSIENAMRYEAKRLLPTKVKIFALEHNFYFSEVKINKSRTRWGSCSSKKSINLSYYCMLLPEHLTDFIILHELCHTVEMNHGDNFWNLLNSVSQGKAKSLTAELKSFKTSL